MPSVKSESPRTPKKEKKPYDHPNSSSGSKGSGGGAGGGGGGSAVKWSQEDKAMVFDHVRQNGEKDWDKACPGKTSQQCREQWK
ncbi:hypothetical protein M231_06434 [Tremella mesenterica]|uniref:Myb-like domain-containing protein n=1 Tax=Tremella mesenterica TaxID=5217 RepID=A0A4Q1BBU7_TREME|nr:hypothetical protein M231_06434 [Tremella mesenterica]